MGLRQNGHFSNVIFSAVQPQTVRTKKGFVPFQAFMFLRACVLGFACPAPLSWLR